MDIKEIFEEDQRRYHNFMAKGFTGFLNKILMIECNCIFCKQDGGK